MKTKICRRCGKELPLEMYGKQRATCKICKSIYDREWRKNHKEHIQQYKEEHHDKIAVYRKQYRICNKELISEKQSQWHANHKKERSYYNKQWLQDNPEKRKILDQKRRAKKLALSATLTEEQWEIIKQFFDGKCAYCGRELPLEQEHFVPLSKGGAYTHNNIVPACSWCNRSKHDKPFIEWYPKQKFYSKKREKAIMNFLGYTQSEAQQPSLMI